MKSNAGLESLSEYAKRFLELLMLPSPVLERDSPYERKETPYCHPHQSEDQESLAVVFSEEARNSTSMGGEDNYHRSNWYNLPNKLITELLTNIRPGGRRTCAVGWVEVFKEDHTFGYDCEEPHDNVSHRKEEISLFAELSEDQNKASLFIKKWDPGTGNLDGLVSLSRTAAV